MNKQQLKAKINRKNKRDSLKSQFGEYYIYHPDYIETFRSPYKSTSERKEIKRNKKIFGRFANSENEVLSMIYKFWDEQEIK